MFRNPMRLEKWLAFDAAAVEMAVAAVPDVGVVGNHGHGRDDALFAVLFDDDGNGNDDGREAVMNVAVDIAVLDRGRILSRDKSCAVKSHIRYLGHPLDSTTHYP